jgi:hypothetical protein
VETVTRPVTQTEVTAVNNASINGVHVPSAEETGSVRITAPITITSRKLAIIIWVVVKCLLPIFI